MYSDVCIASSPATSGPHHAPDHDHDDSMMHLSEWHGLVSRERRFCISGESTGRSAPYYAASGKVSRIKIFLICNSRYFHLPDLPAQHEDIVCADAPFYFLSGRVCPEA